MSQKSNTELVNYQFDSNLSFIRKYLFLYGKRGMGKSIVIDRIQKEFKNFLEKEESTDEVNEVTIIPKLIEFILLRENNTDIRYSHVRANIEYINKSEFLYNSISDLRTLNVELGTTFILFFICGHSTNDISIISDKEISTIERELDMSYSFITGWLVRHSIDGRLDQENLVYEKEISIKKRFDLLKKFDYLLYSQGDEISYLNTNQEAEASEIKDELNHAYEVLDNLFDSMKMMNSRILELTEKFNSIQYNNKK